MKREFNNWHWLLPIFLGLVVTEDVVHFFVMLEVGGLSFRQAVPKLFENFSWLSVFGYLFSTGFRIVPFALLAIIAGLLGFKIRRDFLRRSMREGWFPVSPTASSIPWLGIKTRQVGFW